MISFGVYREPTPRLVRLSGIVLDVGIDEVILRLLFSTHVPDLWTPVGELAPWRKSTRVRNRSGYAFQSTLPNALRTDWRTVYPWHRLH